MSIIVSSPGARAPEDRSDQQKVKKNIPIPGECPRRQGGGRAGNQRRSVFSGHGDPITAA
jgi:hypothetical protein